MVGSSVEIRTDQVQSDDRVQKAHGRRNGCARLASKRRQGMAPHALRHGALALTWSASCRSLASMPQERTTRILVAVDGTDSAGHGLEAAVALAREHACELHLVNAVPLHPAPAAEHHAWGALILERLRAALPPSLRVSTHVREGAPEDVLSALAEELRADLVVVGSLKRHPAVRLLFGSTADDILHSCRCPVLVVQ